MIKKLVKYGNSQALVLDKALLEILNITEGTKLKLATDGKSLIISPIMETANQPAGPISLSEGEMMLNYYSNAKQQGCDILSTVEPEAFQGMMQDMNELMSRYDKLYNYRQRSFALTQSAVYKKEMAELDQRAANTNMPHEEYAKEANNILQKLLPDIPLKDFTKESLEIERKYKKIA